MSNEYLMYYDVYVLKIWHTAYTDDRDTLALQVALLEERSARKRMAQGITDASPRLAAALWCTATSFVAMERLSDAAVRSGELLNLHTSGADVGTMSEATCYMLMGAILHGQCIDMKNSAQGNIRKTATRCLDMLSHCQGIDDDRKCSVVTAFALCYEVLNQRQKALQILHCYLGEVEKTSRYTGLHCDLLDQISEFYYDNDWDLGLQFARKAKIIAGLLGDLTRKRNSLYSVAIHLFHKGSEWDQFATLYKTVNQICTLSRGLEGGKRWLKEMVFGQSQLGLYFLENSAIELRNVARREKYGDVLWALRGAGVRLTEAEKKLKNSSGAKYRKQCAYCGRVLPLRRCSNCRALCYCSLNCQRQDWINHKRVCGKMGSNSAVQLTTKM